jgi:hypothetical protein
MPCGHSRACCWIEAGYSRRKTLAGHMASRRDKVRDPRHRTFYSLRITVTETVVGFPLMRKPGLGGQASTFP